MSRSYVDKVGISPPASVFQGEIFKVLGSTTWGNTYNSEDILTKDGAYRSATQSNVLHRTNSRFHLLCWRGARHGYHWTFRVQRMERKQNGYSFRVQNGYSFRVKASFKWNSQKSLARLKWLPFIRRISTSRHSWTREQQQHNKWDRKSSNSPPCHKELELLLIKDTWN